MRRFVHFITNVYPWLKSTQWLELVSSTLLAVWSFVLFCPPPTFATSPGYRTMAVIDEFWWAVFAGTFALMGIIGLILDQHRLRAAGLMGGVFFWGTVGVCIFSANPGGTGGLVYLALAQFCAGAFVLRRS